jgi:hypothetical protein
MKKRNWSSSDTSPITGKEAVVWGKHEIRRQGWNAFPIDQLLTRHSSKTKYPLHSCTMF